MKVFDTQEDVPVTNLITEPKQGNLFVAGFENGMVKLYDSRQQRRTAVLEWHGDDTAGYKIATGQAVFKTGIVLGESKHFTSAWWVNAPQAVPNANCLVQMA
jgi:hypothetical protein